MRSFFKRRKKKIKKERRITSDEARQKYKDVFGENLVSIVLYGGPADGENVSEMEGASLLVVFKKLDMEAISKANIIYSDFAGKNNLSPLIVEEGELFDVASCFPIDFLAAKSRYKILYGKDVLKDLIISAENLALKAKLEIMKLYLRGRHNLVFSSQDPKLLTRILALDIPHCINALRALLLSKRKHAPAETPDIIERAAEEFSIDAAVLQQVSQIKEGTLQQDKSEIARLFFQYLRELYFAYKAADELALKMSERESMKEADERDFIE